MSLFQIRRDPVSKVIQNLKRHFSQFEQKQLQPFINANQVVLPKLTKDISDVVTLLFGDEKIEPINTNITALVPTLLDATDDLFYKLAKHRTAFENAVQSQIARILVFLIKYGSKHGIADYVLGKTAVDGHNSLIDALLIGYRFEEQHTQAVFAIFQAMTKRKELASMLLNDIKVTQPVRKVRRRRRSAVPLQSFHKQAERTKIRRQSAQRVPAFDNAQQSVARNNGSGHGKHNTEPAACPSIAEIMHSSGSEINFESTDDHKIQSLRTSPTTNGDTQVQAQTAQDITFVDCLFELIKWPSLQVALHAFKTLRCLLVTDAETLDPALHKRVIDTYFQSHAHDLFVRFNALIESDNTVNKKKCFELLRDLLHQKQNIESLLQYVTRPRNLVVARRILSDSFVEAQTDEKQHNLIIELLLERHYESAGEILQDMTCRRNLADLLLNRTKITRLKETQLQLSEINEFDSPCVRDGCVHNAAESTPCMRRSSRTSHFIFHDAINSETKSDGDINEERDLVLELLLLIKRSSSDAVASYAYHCLCGLLTTNKLVAAQYLERNYDALMPEIRAILQLDNGLDDMRRSNVLRLLSTILSSPTTNAAFCKQFSSQVSNLQITMNLLKSKCESTVDDALSIFYVFVSTVRLHRDIHVILWRNTKQRKLISFIRQLLSSSQTGQEPSQTQTSTRQQKKADIIQCLSKLPKPQSDESYVRLPIL
eukprot:CAMPEP_0202694066 /NCGR_PEP_ID=MMETSP1385-20130828/8022_1 /ASSEMBLY_ACC=CAM_ASM_000861 /TAXON_ID=933848 /ORGANISM="Elphidium margaritaceum" /LENGTH=712 /DNA_ID=CAMNT_0049349845 /DNA_START=99 /DNA_END=2237 /DNA_ORIENTATION=-